MSRDAARAVDADILDAMRDRMTHRGPDGAGRWISPDRRVGLGFRRLAIIDLAPEAGQPMTNEDGSIQLVFNGEIYNHRAIRRQLVDLGHRFRTDHADTEVIVHGYEQWGPGVVDRLEGMFAIAVWDSRRQTLFLARDRVGIKPLYFTWLPRGFLAASEIKALLAHPEVSADVEPGAVYHYLSFLTTPAPLTMFRGIYKMPAGHRALVSLDGTMSAERYWDALPGQGDAAVEARELQRMPYAACRARAVERVRDLLEQAVVKRLMSDVPFGVLLSGGVDSSLNVALMTRHLSDPVRTFTVSFADHERLNETTYARQVARRFGTDHREVVVDEQAMREYLPSLVYSQDEPIADWVCIPLYFVSKLVRDSGTTVVQVGEGSDEQFCGYASYMGYLDLYRRYWRPYRLVPSALRRAAGQVAKGLGAFSDRFDTYLDLIEKAGAGRDAFWSGATVFSELRKRRLVDRARVEPLDLPAELRATGLVPPSFGEPDSYHVVSDFFRRLEERAPGADILTRMTYSEFRLRLPELLLMRVDKIGMSVSIEPRVPFLDHRLVEFTMNLPMSLKVGDGVSKSLLKEAARGLLPDEIIDRRKMGFGAPMVEWLRGDFGRQVEDEIRRSRFFDRFPLDRQAILDMLARHRASRADFALYIWTVYNAVAWYDRWVDGVRARSAA